MRSLSSMFFSSSDTPELANGFSVDVDNSVAFA